MKVLFGDSESFGAIANWLMIVAILAGTPLLLPYLVLAVRRGPKSACRVLTAGTSSAIGDVFSASPRRVMALTRLAVYESLRRMVFIVFVIFVALLLFAGWFLRSDNPNPSQIFL